jgi:hypothetical protein
VGIKGIEKISENEPGIPPRPDDEVIERQKREEEGIKPTKPTEIPEEVEEVVPPNPGGANHEE